MEPGTTGEAFAPVFDRFSVRSYSDKPIPEHVKNTILRAAAAGPSAGNKRPWSFLVVDDRALLCKMAEAKGPTGAALRTAQFGVLACGDTTRPKENAKDMWVVDTAIALQNMTLTAWVLGVGSLWIGVWPNMDIVKRLHELFRLPEEIIPHSMMAFGYPAEGAKRGKINPYWDADRYRENDWQTPYTPGED